MLPVIQHSRQTKPKDTERTGSRRTIFGVRPNEAFFEQSRQIGLKEVTEFPFKGAEQYTGEWKASKKEGFGTQIWSNGNKYEGDWVSNKRNGKGTFWVCEESVLRKQYTGDWVNDKRHGVGVFISGNGDRYEGEWRNNVRHGMGKKFYGKGSIEASYNGSWAEGLRSGLGILTLVNGDRFEGHWVDDKKEGPGRFFYRATNKVYEGEWVGDVPKCGQLKEAPVGSFPNAATSATLKSLALPVLRLLGSESVFYEAVAAVRHTRDHKMDSGIRVFELAELEILKKCFSDCDHEGTGYISCADLYQLVQSVGLNVSEAMVDQLVAALEADHTSQLTFAEFADVSAILAEAINK